MSTNSTNTLEGKEYIVLDTNVLLLDANNLKQKDKVVVLPEVVVDEMDSKKSLTNELGYQARSFSRLLRKAKVVGTEKTLEVKVDKLSKGEPLTVIKTHLRLNEQDILFVSFSKYEALEGLSYTNDRKILEVAKYYSDKHNAKFMSQDVNAHIRAVSLGIPVEEYSVVDEVSNEFTREVQVSAEVFSVLHNAKLLEAIPDHKPGTFNYIVSTPMSNQKKLCYVEQGKLKVLGADTEKELTRQPITPIGTQQKFLSRALQEPLIDIVVCEALAGSGKTLLALSNGIRMVKLGIYDSITYIRHSVDDVPREEEVGFLSGNEEKMQVYFHPLYDALEVIVRQSIKGKKLKKDEIEPAIQSGVSELIAECGIKPMTGLGLRGRTITNSYVIIDEAQNPSASSMQKTLTRIGKGSKVAIVGSNNQLDNTYVTKYNNGLSYLLDACKRDNNINIYGVDLHKVLRSDIAEFAENLYTKGINEKR